jgi:hypothetical protein
VLGSLADEDEDVASAERAVLAVVVGGLEPVSDTARAHG